MILGRIDIILQFLHQFGDEEAYLAVECKARPSGRPCLERKVCQQGGRPLRFGPVCGRPCVGLHAGLHVGTTGRGRD